MTADRKTTRRKFLATAGTAAASAALLATVPAAAEPEPGQLGPGPDLTGGKLTLLMNDLGAEELHLAIAYGCTMVDRRKGEMPAAWTASYDALTQPVTNPEQLNAVLAWLTEHDYLTAAGRLGLIARYSLWRGEQATAAKRASQ